MFRKKAKKSFILNLLAGLSFLLPIVTTIWLVFYCYEKFAEAIKGIYVPIYKGLNLYDKLPRHVMVIISEIITVLAVLLAILAIGFVVRKIFTSTRVSVFQDFLEKVPFVKLVYSPIRQVVDSIMEEEAHKVVKFYYPNKPYKAIGIVVGAFVENDGKKYYQVMLPITMSAGMGFLLMVPESETEICNYSVGNVLQHVLSCGMVPLVERDNKISIDGVENFWRMVRKEKEMIILCLSNKVGMYFPENPDRQISFFCQVIYGRADYQTNKKRWIGKGRKSLPWFMRLSCSFSMKINKKFLKKYVCIKTKNFLYLVRKDCRNEALEMSKLLQAMQKLLEKTNKDMILVKGDQLNDYAMAVPEDAINISGLESEKAELEEKLKMVKQVNAADDNAQSADYCLVEF